MVDTDDNAAMSLHAPEGCAAHQRWIAPASRGQFLGSCTSDPRTHVWALGSSVRPTCPASLRAGTWAFSYAVASLLAQHVNWIQLDGHPQVQLQQWAQEGVAGHQRLLHPQLDRHEISVVRAAGWVWLAQHFATRKVAGCSGVVSSQVWDVQHV